MNEYKTEEEESGQVLDEQLQEGGQKIRIRMSANLANLKEVCETFVIDQYESNNVEKRWKSWLENFEICTEYEGIEDPKKRRAALLAVAGPQIRELLSTLEEDDEKTFDTVKAVFNAYFKGKKNLTAERYRFLCLKPLSDNETHDAWITRLKKIGLECEWDQMTLKEAIKLAVIMHTKSPKLQADIIAQDMDYDRMVEKARAIELTKKEVANIKQAEKTFQVDAMRYNHDSRQQTTSRGGHNQGDFNFHNRGRNKTRQGFGRGPNRGQFSNSRGNQYRRHANQPSTDAPGLCKNCGFRATDRHECRAKEEFCLACHEKGHYARMCSKRYQGVNQLEEEHAGDAPATHDEYDFDSVEFALDKVDVDQSMEPQSREKKYPDTNIHVRINGHKVMMKIDSGAEATVISSDVFWQIQNTATQEGRPIKLKSTSARLRPYNSPPIPVRGMFQAEMVTKRARIITTVYVTEGKGIKSLLSKYAAFDLGILHITADELVSGLSRVKKRVPERKHLEYHEIAKKITSEDAVKAKYAQLKTPRESPTQVEEMINIFDEQFHGIGCHKYRQIKLDIEDTVTPIVQAQRRIPFAKREKLDEILKELEDDDVIEEVKGPTDWISNLVLTPKTDQKMRMNIDMTTGNTAIKRTRHVVPTIEELKYSLNGAEVFSKLDMRQGYMQLQLHPDSRHMTVFYTHQGLRRMKRLSFGINSAAELFHEEIKKTLSDISNCKNTYDDIIVYGRNQAEHNEALFRVLQRLSDCGLTLKREKCEFNKSEIKFFGFIFNKEGMKPDPEKIDALRKTEPPKSLEEMRSFLGMCNFSSHFIPNYSILTGPLREMTRKGVHFEWTPERRTAFNNVKNILQADTTLGYYDPKMKTRLYVDGSKKDGVGSILAQLDPLTGRYKPIRYDSRALTDPETRYSQIEVESLSIYTGIMKCHMYLYGLKEFEVVTDHQPLLPLYNKIKENMPPRVKHHRIMTQGYNYKVLYEKGSTNPSDFLSRHPQMDRVIRDEADEQWDIDVDTMINWAIPETVTLKKIQETTEASEPMQELKKAIERGFVERGQTVLQPYKKIMDELSCEQGIILRGERIIIPEELQSEIIQIAHESHLGRVKTIGIIKETMWFPGLDKKVNDILDQCVTCQVVTDGPIKEPLKMSELPQQPWTRLVTDFYGPLKSGEHLLVVQDTYTRFPVVEIVHSTAANTVIAAMDRIMSLYGVPEDLGSDNGTPYQSADMENFAKYMGYKHNHKIPYAPWANGQAENFMKNLKKLMMVCEVEKKNWRQQLQRFLRAYRASPHKSTGFAPATLMFNGRQYKTRLPSKKIGENVYHEQVKANDAQAKSAMKLNSDRKSYVKESSIAVGDRVLIKQQKENKTTPPYKPQPYTVTSRNGSQVVAKYANHVVHRHTNHCKKLKPFPEEKGEENVRKLRKVRFSEPSEEGSDTEEGRPETDTSLLNNRTMCDSNEHSIEEAPILPHDTVVTNGTVEARPESMVPPDNNMRTETRGLRPRQSLRKPEWYGATNNTQ